MYRHPIVAKARLFAQMAHGSQQYGTVGPYSVHLEDVERVLAQYTQSDDLKAAAWLHDVIEDTEYKSLEGHGFPDYVVELVQAVTDEPGKNRKERKAATYKKIIDVPDAVVLKLADRIANVEACRKNNNNPNLLAMYRSEHPAFLAALRDAPVTRVKDIRVMWDRLITALRFGP